MNITMREVLALARILLVPFLVLCLALGASLYQWHRAEIQAVRYQVALARVSELETDLAILEAKTDAYKQLLENEMKLVRLIEAHVSKLAVVVDKLVDVELDTQSRWGPM